MTTHSAFCFCALCRGEDSPAADARRARDAALDRNEWEEDQEILQQTRAAASNYNTEENEMLTRGGGETTAAKSNRSSQPGGLPWLKPANLSTERRTLSILMARAEKDRWGNQSVVLKVRYDGTLYLWQPNAKNPNYDLLIDILGSDETKWAGNEVVAHLEQDPLTEVYWIRVESANEKPAKGKR